MGTEQNKDVAHRYYVQVLNDGDVGLVDELAVEPYEEHDPVPGQGTGRQGLKDRLRILRGAFGQTFTVEDIVAEGDRVVVRWTGRGTHSGEFMGIPPTGRSFTIAGIDVIRFEEGRMAEHWHVVDQLALMQQLGLIPAPESSNA
ncbi:MAG: ester cyclase [Actinomycetota bacterium]